MSIYKDTEPHKLHRKNDPDTSVAAASTVLSGSDRKAVHGEIESSGEGGITLKEICLKYNWQMSSKSSRCSELEKSGAIFYRGDKRGRCRVMRLSKYKLEPGQMGLI
jgi:hypothetical protein|tara:strand:- start:483 stop:803 length:321 start_codon:yes stop_codon:yes gene_type:complete